MLYMLYILYIYARPPPALSSPLARRRYLADRVVVYTGRPSIEATATAPQPLLSGMNQFLRQLEITFRRDPVATHSALLTVTHKRF